jgi:hypothetical protein
MSEEKKFKEMASSEERTMSGVGPSSSAETKKSVSPYFFIKFFAQSNTLELILYMVYHG